MSATAAPAISPAVARAKRELKAKGWSYRTAAPECGVCYQHLSEVLNGKRRSRALLERIAKLPKREEAEV